jgi:hypothetical protein
MYSTCIFCHSALGSNEAVEHFPVGRRLAFDAAKGRLWVVCRQCERWNLTPLEERWEAIEECERLFANTRLRVSTDNIGLARIREGLELVRIGEPKRPEMAAWRYGDQFGRRRRKHLLWTGAGFAAVGGIFVLGPLTGIIAGGSWGLWNLLNIGHSAYQQRRIRARLVIPQIERPVPIRSDQLSRVSIIPHEEGGWALRVSFPAPVSGKLVSSDPSGAVTTYKSGSELSAVFKGSAAVEAAGRLLPAINAAGAKRDEVQSAVQLIERSGDPWRLLSGHTVWPSGYLQQSMINGRALGSLPHDVRLALEMAAHEDSERRAIEGELSLLEDAWRQAEEIAAIADDLFVPAEARRRLATLKGETERPSP